MLAVKIVRAVVITDKQHLIMLMLILGSIYLAGQQGIHNIQKKILYEMNMNIIILDANSALRKLKHLKQVEKCLTFSFVNALVNVINTSRSDCYFSIQNKKTVVLYAVLWAMLLVRRDFNIQHNSLFIVNKRGSLISSVISADTTCQTSTCLL